MADTDLSDNLISIARHLTRAEADTMKASLQKLKIDCVITRHHATTFYNSFYYELRVSRTDKRTAKEVLGRITARAFIEARKCPRCKTLGYREMKKRWWEKLFYFGTTLIQCHKCKRRYSV